MKSIKKIFKFLRTLARVPLKYQKSLKYLLKNKGLRQALNFLFMKYTVSDEGGEVALLNTLITTTKLQALATYPFKVEVEHTTCCNKKCIMCEHSYWSERQERLSFEKYKSILDQFPRARWANVTGEGTGFLNPDFLKIIEYLRSRDISVNFVDEFDFLDEQKARKLVELGVNCIWISMDGARKETYEKIKVGCNFEKALSNIKALLRIKKELGSPFPVLCFRFIVNNINYQEMPQMVELIHSLGDLGEGAVLEFTGLLTFPQIKYLELPEIPEKIIEEAQKRAKELNVNISFSHLQKEKLPSINNCAAWTEPYIMMGGWVLPCCAVLMSNRRDFLRKYAFGNTNEKSFKEIWNSPRYRKFRKMIISPKEKVPILCAGCRAYETKEREKKYGISSTI